LLPLANGSVSIWAYYPGNIIRNGINFQQKDCDDKAQSYFIINFYDFPFQFDLFCGENTSIRAAAPHTHIKHVASRSSGNKSFMPPGSGNPMKHLNASCCDLVSGFCVFYLLGIEN
jgi:hypothetical protein